MIALVDQAFFGRPIGLHPHQLSKKNWCPGTDLHRRHADIQSDAAQPKSMAWRAHVAALSQPAMKRGQSHSDRPTIIDLSDLTGRGPRATEEMRLCRADLSLADLRHEQRLSVKGRGAPPAEAASSAAFKTRRASATSSGDGENISFADCIEASSFPHFPSSPVPLHAVLLRFLAKAAPPVSAIQAERFPQLVAARRASITLA